MEPVAAQLYDGVRARPRSLSLHLRDDVLVLVEEGAAALEWNVDRIRAVHRVASELHIEVAAEEGQPALKLVVEDRGFEARLDEVRSRFDARPSVGLGALVRRLSLKAWLLIAAVVIPGAYLLVSSLLPNAHVLISKEIEAELGDKLYEVLASNWKVVEDEEFEALIADMVDQLRDEQAGFNVRVALVEEDMPNAFALPGGRIVIFTGLLEECRGPDALAGVLAHEIAHVEERHSIKHLLRTFGVLYFASCVVGGGVEQFATAETLAELSSGLLILKHSRDHEREADEVAVVKMHRHRHSVKGMMEFFDSLGREMPDSSVLAWASTHPLSSERVATLARHASAEDFETEPWVDGEEWLRMVERLTQREKRR